MSRSRKKPILKNHIGRWYNRILKRWFRQMTKNLKYLDNPDDFEYPNPNSKVDVSECRCYVPYKRRNFRNYMK